ncbi:sigma 54-interacting transcriptional regulator [Aestuariicoccus sp. MJ-SS9]|uniref:sigma 54-interacting transcriptional regulator n=1 Tax=Aestuariicoccus sp. MJ-SS9 TaxID=3079855 RepID=UPI00290FD988|nr:sigma 54-interacting transcriptional regulator [Aestuariicoccus sp. MJ-SS9]MDU8910986.1 sigma 54-interacting transcriptional regulator [Aestuariicoccus sp. MJ-SS9]
MLDRITAPDSLLVALPQAALLLDTADDRIVTMNDEAAQLFGIDPEDPPRFSALLGKALPDFVVFVEEIDHRGTGWTRGVAMRDGAGEPLKLEISGRPVPDQTGLLVLTFLDLDALDRRTRLAEASDLQRAGLTEWKRAESFFAELERQNQLILNAAGEGIYGVNAEGKTTFVNRAAQEMLGWTTEDLLGRDIHSMIHHHHLSGEIYPSHDCPIYRSFRFEQVNRIENEVFWRKDGKPIQVEYVSTPIYDQKVLAGAVVIFRDITERKESERKLREAMEQVADLRDRLEQENAYLQEQITSERAHHDIIGSSPSIRQVLAKIDLVAQTEATVLISGETGTGKALVATAIHNESPRRRRPLIHFKCSSVSPDAIEAELFGQMRGAFQGALRDKPGKLELAHGGTLFLDDVEELPLDQQGRLLNALQTREVTRLGDTRARHIDIRVIAASTTNLERAVSAGQMRDDLYLALNVFPILCHPLRERHEDIPELTAHMLDMACKRLNRRKPIITEGVMQRLLAYSWPGNVRELRNVIERAAIVSQSGKLIVEIGESRPEALSSNPNVKTEAEIQQEIRANLIACLKDTHGRVSGPGGAAELLGVPTTTFYSRLKKHRIGPADWQG